MTDHARRFVQPPGMDAVAEPALAKAAYGAWKVLVWPTARSLPG